MRDRRLARILRRCEALPGQELFSHVGEDGQLHPVASQEVNAYLREVSCGEFTTKDFRTWAGTVLATRALREMPRADSVAQARRNVVAAVESVARSLGNTRAVCRKCYVHPAIVESYLAGSWVNRPQQRTGMERGLRSLSREEVAVLALLEQRLGKEAPASGQVA